MELNPLFFIAASYVAVVIFVALIVLINDAIVYLHESYKQREIKKARLEPNLIYHRPRNYQTTNLVKKAA